MWKNFSSAMLTATGRNRLGAFFIYSNAGFVEDILDTKKVFPE